MSRNAKYYTILQYLFHCRSSTWVKCPNFLKFFAGPPIHKKLKKNAGELVCNKTKWLGLLIICYFESTSYFSIEPRSDFKGNNVRLNFLVFENWILNKV